MQILMINCRDREANSWRVLSSTEAQMGALWNELKNWRRSEHWNTKKFFQALIFGLLFTFLDTVTDIVFARSVPDWCPDLGISESIQNNTIKICEELSGRSVLFHQRIGIHGSQNHCGHFFSPVKFAAYTFIALPGIMLSFSALHSILRELWKRICGSEVPGCLAAVINATALLLQMSLCTGLVLLPLFSVDLEIQKKCSPAFESIIEGFETTIQAMAYSSAAFLIGVKLLGTICHGPEVTKLVERATDAEVRYEAALQLILLTMVYLTTWTRSLEIRNSAISSILVIGKIGIHNFFKEHNNELSKASLLGKIYIAASVSPVFVLAAIFKVGSLAIVFITGGGIDYAFLTCLPPALVIFLAKTCLPLKNLTVASISQGVVASAVTLHLWPGEQVGKRIVIGMIAYTHFFYSFYLARRVIDYNNNSHDNDSYMRNSAIFCLVIGWASLPFIVCLVLFQEHYVAHVVSRNPKDRDEEE